MRKMIGGNLARENSKFSENSDLKMRVHKRKKEENDESEQKNQIKKKSCDKNFVTAHYLFLNPSTHLKNSDLSTNILSYLD